MTDVREFELSSPPSDGISSLCFSPMPANFLLVTSWDQTVRLYDVVNNSQRASFDIGSPALCGAISSPIQGFSGAIDGVVRSHDLNSGTKTDLGSHTEAVRCLEYNQSHNTLISGSWDKTVQAWDPRAPGASTATANLPDKVYTMSTQGDKLVVGTAGRHVWIYDVRNLSAPEQRRESSLKFQTRTVKLNNEQDGYVLASIDGRVAVEWMDPTAEAQAKKYAFKCHRAKNEEGKDVIYPINTIAFHPKHGTFATGGCDGTVNVWDGAKRKRLCQFHKYPTSISALAFNYDGFYLAIAASYSYEEGEKEHPADAIYIRETTEEETKPKA